MDGAGPVSAIAILSKGTTHLSRYLKSEDSRTTFFSGYGPVLSDQACASALDRAFKHKRLDFRTPAKAMHNGQTIRPLLAEQGAMLLPVLERADDEQP